MKHYIYVYFQGFDPNYHEKCFYWFEAEEEIGVFETIAVVTKYGNFEGIVVDEDNFETSPSPIGKQVITRRNIKRYTISEKYDDYCDDKRKEKLENAWTV